MPEETMHITSEEDRRRAAAAFIEIQGRLAVAAAASQGYALRATMFADDEQSRFDGVAAATVLYRQVSKIAEQLTIVTAGCRCVNTGYPWPYDED